MHEPGSRETALVERGARVARLRRGAPRPRRGRLASPSTPTCRTTSKTPARPGAVLLAVVSAGPAKELTDACQARCSTRSGTPTRSRPACSTSTCTWSTRSPARRRSRACASPAARSAGPTARSPRPTTTCRPTARRSPRGSATSSRRAQVETLERNCEEFGIPLYSLGSDRQGIVHVIGPELGVTQPGMTIVCGDSHTATHGAFGALAFGIGTSEVEHVLATQCLGPAHARSRCASRYEGAAGPRRHGEGPDPRHDRPDGRRRRASATSSSTPARPSRRSRWRAE